jgi:dihydroflavonol-4-reductase
MSTVLVTGGTGFIAGWCIVQLLDAGHDVVSTVRSTEKEPAVRDAVAARSRSIDALRFVVADLTVDEAWDGAMAGCDYVLHVASPLAADASDAESFIRPAREGARRVLAAAARAGVSRVVMTSSCAAATPPPSQLTGTVDETCWTDADEPGLAPYRRSKVLAERAAWDFVADRPISTELTTVLPASVFGPAFSRLSMSSLNVIAGLLDGSTPALPRLGFEVVDVRDVAAAHLLAMTAPAAAGERFIVSGELLWFGDIAEILRVHLGPPAQKVTTESLPDDVLRSLAKANPQLRSLLPLLGRELHHSSAKARDQLGWDPRPALETIIESGAASSRCKAMPPEQFARASGRVPVVPGRAC